MRDAILATKIMNCFALFVLLALCLGAITAEMKAKKNLDPDAQLRIGVKFRPPKCDRKTNSGDRLSMHYTGEKVWEILRGRRGLEGNVVDDSFALSCRRAAFQCHVTNLELPHIPLPKKGRSTLLGKNSTRPSIETVRSSSIWAWEKSLRAGIED